MDSGGSMFAILKPSSNYSTAPVTAFRDRLRRIVPWKKYSTPNAAKTRFPARRGLSAGLRDASAVCAAHHHVRGAGARGRDANLEPRRGAREAHPDHGVRGAGCAWGGFDGFEGVLGGV